MARYAIGDLQGCHDELRALLRKLKFSTDRDRLYLVGDLVNRGPQSLKVLQFIRALGDNAVSVLGNHDLHLLARGYGGRTRSGDSFDDVLQAPDREELLEWLRHRPLAHRIADGDELLLHAGLVPQWTIEQALRLAAEVEQELRERPEPLFAAMYGNKPDCWSDDLNGAERHRFVVNVLTRLRYCTPDGVVNLQLKDAPAATTAPFMPWFDIEPRASQGTRIVFGHWSTLGLLQRPDLLALDTGCVWGGALTAVDLDHGRVTQVACSGHLRPG